MKVLYIGFKGKNNATTVLLEQVEHKVLLTNSYASILTEISALDLSSYEKIFLFGIKKELKDEILIEPYAKTDLNVLKTALEIEDYRQYFIEKNIK